MSIHPVLHQKPVWERDGIDWPNRELSRFVDAGGLTWHVQEGGDGPGLLLVHGTGSATHSWLGLLPLLATRFRVLAMDLPGHGFTAVPAPRRLSLSGMAEGIGALCRELALAPEVAVGQSAGAAIAARMCLDGLIEPKALVSLSGALLPLRGLPATWFKPAARLTARGAWLPRFFAAGARRDPRSIDRMVASTGSRLPPEQVARYRMLISHPGHLSAALNMMANWDLEPLRRDLPALRPHLILAAFDNDKTVPPSEAERVKALLPSAELRRFDRLGHLAHEEDPDTVAELIFDVAKGLISGASRAPRRSSSLELAARENAAC